MRLQIETSVFKFLMPSVDGILSKFRSTVNTIGLLHDSVTWYKTKHAGRQVAQWDWDTATCNLPLFWKSRHETCVPTCAILYHRTGSYKGPIDCNIPEAPGFFVLEVAKQYHFVAMA